METVPEPPNARKKPLVSREAWIWIASLVTVVLIVGMAMNAGDVPEPVAAVQTPTPAITPQVSTAPPPRITIDCGHSLMYLLIGETPNFTQGWAAQSDNCRATRPVGVPLTSLEREAFEKSGYTKESSVQVLYGICAQADPDGYFTSGDHDASPAQAAELRGALVLCPDHPFVDELDAAAEHGEAEAELEKDVGGGGQSEATAHGLR